MFVQGPHWEPNIHQSESGNQSHLLGGLGKAEVAKASGASNIVPLKGQQDDDLCRAMEEAEINNACCSGSKLLTVYLGLEHTGTLNAQISHLQPWLILDQYTSI